VVITVTAVPPEKSIPGVTGMPVVAILRAISIRATARIARGIITNCFGEYFSIL
jgi:hypothetical protein